MRMKNIDGKMNRYADAPPRYGRPRRRRMFAFSELLTLRVPCIPSFPLPIGTRRRENPREAPDPAAPIT